MVRANALRIQAGAGSLDRIQSLRFFRKGSSECSCTFARRTS